MFKNLDYFDVANKRILLRCDFNVPLDGRGIILDDFRIVKSLPTIQYLIKNKAKIILISHLGEPDGQVIETLKLNNVKEKLEELLNVSIIKTQDCVGQEVQKAAQQLKPGNILLLENVRFHKEETDNNVDFARELSELGDIYINDAFSDCHRSHASIVSVPQFLPHGMGLLLQNEIENLTKILEHPKKPLVVLIGGVKVGTKAKFIENILRIADFVIVNGLIKKELGQSSPKILSPAGDLDAPDINEEARAIFKEKILQAKTIVWNGPFGKCEDEQYKNGTLQIAKAIIESGAFSVVGGGETVAFLQKEGMLEDFSHVSTGGGAMLDYLSGEILPGLKALTL